MTDILTTETVNSYYVSDIDDLVYPYYYGYLNDEGQWYIMRVTTTGDIKYNRPSFQSVGLYSAAWTNRINLQYTYWNEGF